MALQIADFAVNYRNIVDLGKPQEPFRAEVIQEAVKDLIAPESERFTVIRDVSQRVCSMAYEDLARMELPQIEVLDRPGLLFWENEKIVAEISTEKLYTGNLYLALHRSGVLLINIHVRYQSEGIPIRDTIELVRLHLRTVAIKLPDQLAALPLPEIKEERCRCFRSGKGAYFVGSLKDLASSLLRPMFIQRLEKKFPLSPMRDLRCISSTLVQLYRTEPPCESIEKFVAPDGFGREILGLGTQDRSYHTRTEDAVRESFASNLSTDEEAGVYTFVLSDLIIFDSSFEKMAEGCKSEKHFHDPYSAVLYWTTHYSCLLEWVYLEKYLIDLYNRMLARVAAKEDTSPAEMLRIQKESMHDLIGYKGGITPFPSREDFWERARVGHRILDAQEKLEKKRDLVTDYVLQEYTLRTNRSIQLVNIFISATAAFGLMEVILSIAQERTGKFWWGLATVGLFIGMLGLLWGLNRLFLAVAKKKV